jgi:hypothetical protein
LSTLKLLGIVPIGVKCEWLAMSSNGCEVWKGMETITRGSEVWQKFVSPQLGAIVNSWRCVVLNLTLGFSLQ